MERHYKNVAAALAAPLVTAGIFLGVTAYKIEERSHQRSEYHVHKKIDGIFSASILTVYDEGGVSLSQSGPFRSYKWYHDTDCDGLVDFLYDERLGRPLKLIDREYSGSDLERRFQDADETLGKQLARFGETCRYDDNSLP